MTAILAAANSDEQKLTAYSAAVSCSAEAVGGDLSELRLLRITYRSLPAKFTEWLLSDLLRGRTRPRLCENSKTAS